MQRSSSMLCFLCAMLAFTSLSAQLETVQPRLGLGLIFAAPQEEYQKVSSSTGVGFNASLLFPLAKQVPVYAGLDFGYLLFGSNTQRETLTADITANGVLIDQIEMPLRVTTTNNAYLWHAVIRAQAPIPFVQPYVQGLIGFRYMNTKTQIYDDSPDGRWSDSENGLIVEQTQLFDWVGSYGFGGGVMFRVGRSVMVDARMDYLYGGKAQYYDGEDTDNWEVEFSSNTVFDPETVSGEDLDFSAEPKESYTNMLTFTLGISILMGNAASE